jgi:putative hydrolase of the HAD superfamily
MSIIKTIFFDYDGVLTLDKTGTQSICNYISKKYGIDKDIFEKEYRKYNTDLLYGKITHEIIWKKICSNLNENIPISILYESFINTPVNMQMHDLVKAIKEKDIKTGLITDNKADRIKIISEKHRLNELFDVIKISAEIGSGKEKEEIFIAALTEINCKPYECIFIDNHEKNLIVPKNMRMETIYYDDEKRDIGKLKMELRNCGIVV